MSRAALTVVAGACGGAGTSLLASALALAAARDAGAPTWLVDLDHDRGDLGPAWDAVGQRTTEDLLPVLGELTQDHVRAAGRAHVSGVTLLAAPARRGAAAKWDAAATERLLAAVRDAAGPGGRVVADLGTGDARAHNGALLVCPPTLAGARRAARAADEATTLVVAGRPGRGELGARTLGRLTGVAVVGELPWSPREAAALGGGRWRAGRRARLARAVLAIAAGARA